MLREQTRLQKLLFWATAVPITALDLTLAGVIVCCEWARDQLASLDAWLAKFDGGIPGPKSSQQ